MGYPFWPFGVNMSEEQWEALQEQLGVNLGDPPKPTKRAAFDLEEQDDDDFATFLAEVEKNLNEAADRELEKEAEAEARVSELKESVNE